MVVCLIKMESRRVFSIIEILPPKHICTETYIIVGVFDNKKFAENFEKYLKTYFVRFLVSQLFFLKTSQKIGFRLCQFKIFQRYGTIKNYI